MRLTPDRRLEIDVQPASSEVLHFAAGELRRYLGAVLGAGPDWGMTGELAGRIVLRAASSAPPPLLERAADRWCRHRDGDVLVLTGASERAVLFGVYAWLAREAGCRWLRPGVEAIPRADAVTLDEEPLDSEPDFGRRGLLIFPFYPERTLGEIDWAAKRGLNTIHIATNSSDHWKAFRGAETVSPAIRQRGLDLQFGGHTFYQWISPRQHLRRHPEYFSLIDGVRTVSGSPPLVPSICLSNPDLPRVAADAMLAFLEANPATRVLDIWANDGYLACQCPGCQALVKGLPDSIFGRRDERLPALTDIVLDWVNRIAERVAASHPGVWLNYLAYFNMIDLPRRVAPHPNVLIGFAPLHRLIGEHQAWKERDLLCALDDPDNPVSRRFLPLLEGWRALTDRLYVYDWWSHCRTSRLAILWDTPAARVPADIYAPEKAIFLPATRTIARDYALYRRLGIRGVSSEGWDWHELNMHAYAAFAWDTTTDREELIADYCRHAWPDAAAPMTAFWQQLESAGRRWPALRTAGEALLHQAIDASPAAQRNHLETFLTCWRNAPDPSLISPGD